MSMRRRSVRFACFVLAAAAAAGHTQQYTISTYAGGTALPPTPLAAASASIGSPLSVAADASGNVYFTSLNCVFKIDTSGTLTRIAGLSQAGFTGDGGPATSAHLDFVLGTPAGIAVDSAGNLYIADPNNSRIRMISANGTITTVAGNGQFGFSGDGGPATSAQLYSPTGVAVDASGNLYIADTNNQRIRKVSTNGTITTVAGTGQSGSAGDGGPATSALFRSPQGVAIDAAGNLYIADANNARVRKVSSGIITTVAGGGNGADGGPATSAQLGKPQGVAVDAAGNLYIADSSDDRIRKVSMAGIISTVAGNEQIGFSGDGGPASSAVVNRPQGVALDAAGNLYIADSNNSRVRKVSTGGIITTLAGGGSGGDGGPATSAQLESPLGVAVDAAGDLFIADTNGNRARRVLPNGTISTAAGNGTSGYSGDGGPATGAQLWTPYGVAVDSAGNLFIAEATTNRVRKVSNGVISTVAGTTIGGFSGDGGPATSAQLFSPQSVAVDASGNLYIADSMNNRVRKVSPSGVISTVAGNGQSGYSGDGGPATSAQLGEPWGVAIDSAGNLYIADYFNFRIRKVSTSGVITTAAGNGQPGSSGDGGSATNATLYYPRGVAVDSAGNLFIADTDNNRIRKVSSTGIITTIAGMANSGYSGDGGPATSARLNLPSALAVDAAGNVYIADVVNEAIRLLTSASSESVGLLTPCINGLQVDINGGATPGPAVTSIVFNWGDGSTTTNFFPQSHTYAAAGQYTIQVTANYNGGSSASTSQGVTVGPGVLSGCLALTISSGTNGSVAYQASVGSGTVAAGSSTTLQLASGDGPSLTAQPASGYVFSSWTASSGVTGLGGTPISTSSPAINTVVNSASTISASFAANSVVVTATPATLSFAAVQGATPPAQALKISAAQGASFTAGTSTTTGGAWLNVSPGAGVFPATLSVQVNTTALAPGNYSGAVIITAGGGPTPVAVTLIVSAAATATQLTAPASVTLQGQLGSGSQIVTLSNPGGTALSFTAAASTANGGNWLSILPMSGSVGPLGSAQLIVSFNAQGLAPGVYTGTISINGGAITIPVELVVPPSGPVLLVGQSGLVLTAVAGATNAPSQSVFITNTGAGAMPWSTAVVRGAGISVAPSSGSSTAGAATLSTFTVQANTSGLAAGSYYGLIQVAATGAANSPAAGSPQFLSTVLNVLPAGSTPPIRIYPQALILSSNSLSQSVALGTASAVTAVVATQTGGSWLSADTSSVGSVKVTGKATGLSAGVYGGTVTIVPSDGSPSQDIAVSLVVTASSGPAAQSSRSPAAANCTPSKLVLAMRQLANNFSSPVGWPVNLEGFLSDDCGDTVTAATVIATFSNGDPALALPSLGTGIYSATWKPQNTAATTVTVRASQGSLTPAVVLLTGNVGTNNAPPPIIGTGGVVNAASFAPGADLAPGSIVSVFGSNLGTANTNALTFPLPTTLANIKLTIGGIDAPLFFSSTGQVNAQIPVELVPGTQSQVVPRGIPASGAELDGVPESITVSAAHPGIFTTNGTQGAILNVANQLVDATHPATSGDVIVIFCTGLGAVTPPVATGQAPSSGTVALMPSVTIAGASAAIQYAGVAPGFVGLYQVNAVVPSGLGTNASAPVVVTQNGVASNQGTIAVH